MKPLDPNNWNDDAYHFMYRKGTMFKELCMVDIISVHNSMVTYTINTEEYYFLDSSLTHNRCTVKPLNWGEEGNFDSTVSAISKTHTFFELEVADLVHFI